MLMEGSIVIWQFITHGWGNDDIRIMKQVFCQIWLSAARIIKCLRRHANILKVRFWRSNFEGQILRVRFWGSDLKIRFEDQILKIRFWRSYFEGHILKIRFLKSDIEGQLLKVSFWRSDTENQVLRYS